MGVAEVGVVLAFGVVASSIFRSFRKKVGAVRGGAMLSIVCAGTAAGVGAGAVLGTITPLAYDLCTTSLTGLSGYAPIIVKAFLGAVLHNVVSASPGCIAGGLLGGLGGCVLTKNFLMKKIAAYTPQTPAAPVSPELKKPAAEPSRIIL